MISYNVPINARRMTIGVQGEDNVREFLFDITEWRALTGDIGTAEMVVQRNGDVSPYAAVITMHNENTVSWIPTSTDTEKVGAGKLQLMWFTNDQIVKTKIFDMKVDPALDYKVPDTSLDPWKSWVSSTINAAAKLKVISEEISDIKKSMTSPYNFMGALDTENDLPDATPDNKNDTYYLINRKYRVTSNGTAWEQSSMEESQYTDELAEVKSAINGNVNIEGINQVKPKNLQILTGYENLVNPNTFTVNKFLYANGTLSDNNGYRVSDYIPVVPGQTYIYVARITPISEGASKTTAFRSYVFYDLRKNVVEGSSTSTDTPITIPNGVYYLRFCVSYTYPYMLLTGGSTEKPYIEYGTDNFKVNQQYLPDLSQFVTMDDIEAEKEFVNLPMTTFMHYSKNMVDPAKVSNGYINQASGEFSANDGYRATDFIPVVAGTTYGIIGATDNSWVIRYCWYNGNKTRISGELTELATLNYVLTAPTGAEYIRFSTSANPLYQPYYFAPSATKPTYEPYGSGYLKPEYIPSEDLESTVVNLPKKVYAYVGYELNIYFENLVEDWTKYDWNVNCSKGRQMERGFNITPVSGDVGSYELSIIISISDTVYKTVSTTLVISTTNAGAGSTKKIIVLGDSTTANGIAVTKLNQNFENDSMHIQTLGTRGTTPNNHEGRSGWRFSSYFQPSTDPGVENPWYNPNTQTFDASYYFAQTGIAKPDWLFINLGINDTFGYGNDASLDSGIATIMQQCDAMITSIKNAGSGIKVGLCLTIPPNHSQDAFGKAYQCEQTRDRYKRNNVIWVSKLIDEYDGRENERIYLIPIYTNLDTVWNMGMETLPVNARNTEDTYQSPIGNGGVHPVESGYWQIADVYTAFLKGNAT